MPLTTVSPGLLDSNAQYYGFKNRIINGAMGIWQRGTSSSVVGNYGSADRWVQTAGSGITTSQSTDVPAGFKYSISATGANFPAVYQRIESVNCTDLAGQPVTFSFWAKQTSGTGGLVAYLQYAGSTDNWASPTNVTGSVLTIASPTSTWAQYSLTVPSMPSQTANGIQLIIYGNTTGSATFLITGVQLEKGSTATAFDYRPYGTELILCQRYYEVGNVRWDGYATNGVNYTAVCCFKATKRATPTFTPTNTSVTSFVSAANQASINTDSSYVYHQANATASGSYVDTWTASAEL